MKLIEIKNRVLSLPTIMDISDEILIINELMSIDTDDLIENKDVFYFISKAVELSHTDSGFMLLTRENEGDFIRFYHWLRKIKLECGLELHDNYIETFNMTFDEVEKSMSTYK